MTLVKHQQAPVRNLFNEFFFNPAWTPNQPTAVTQPAVNIAETPEGFRLEVAAPGFNKEDFTVKVENKHLVISGKKEVKTEENGPVYRRREFGFTEFERSFRLNDTIDTDSVTAALENGVLHVTLTKKAEHQPTVKTVAIA